MLCRSAEFQQAYNSGEYFIMQNAKTEKMWSSLMKVAENGHNQVVTPLLIATGNHPSQSYSRFVNELSQYARVATDDSTHCYR